MKDPDYNSDEETPYECFECGNIIIVTAADSPGRCLECGGELRNRHYPIE